MGYTTGTVASFTAMQTALKDACVADGWAWDGTEEVLSKGTMFVKLFLVSEAVYGDGLAILGRTSLTAGDGPNYVHIGALGQVALAFPVTYHAFTFTNEVYFIISSGDTYQYLTFGQSTQPGITGTGCYYSGSLPFYVSTPSSPPAVLLGATYSVSNCPAFGWAGDTSNEPYQSNTFVHSDLDGAGWALDYFDTKAGHYYLTELLSAQPNTYNVEAVLLPIKLLKGRPSGFYSQVMEAANSRYLRNDYYADETILTIGTDKWMVFPFLKRNIEVRGGGYNHSGTLAWAIKYEGP